MEVALNLVRLKLEREKIQSELEMLKKEKEMMERVVKVKESGKGCTIF